MRIAQVAPLYESVPPKLYGGTERIVSYLTEELVRRGHDVTLFASGDSVTRARLVSVYPRALRLDPTIVDQYVCLMAQVGLVYKRADEFDLIHSHVDYFTFPSMQFVRTPTLTTLHGRLDVPELQVIYRMYPDVNLVSISDSQRSPMPNAPWLSTVYNGVPLEDFPFQPRPGDYLAFLGRISPEKRTEVAIKVARKAGIKLKIAAKVDRVDRDYFEHLIKPMLKDPLVEYLGEIDQRAKGAFLGNALALIFPIDWPEPFGLAMAEAMACGTPVIATRRGSVPEIVQHGKTGFICDSIDEMVAACHEVHRLDRRACRQEVESRFSVQVMVDNYEAVYRRLVGGA
ncbi:MAG: glycosyltransferase family 4 protein [Chloroflexi bacterium]|nr:glycosyltransferase family 4 protein [Chloroflexota bacterium]